MNINRVGFDTGVHGWGEMAFLGAHSRTESALASEVDAIAEAHYLEMAALEKQRAAAQ